MSESKGRTWLRIAIALGSVGVWAGLNALLFRASASTGGSQAGAGALSGLALASTFQPPPEQPPGPEESAPPPREPEGTGLRKLTPQEINRIRYLELRGSRLRNKDALPDRVSVKIPKTTVDEFLVQMEGSEDFKGEKARQNFRKLTAPQKLHWIAHYGGAKYADKVEITSDPEVFLNFKKHVMPLVLKGCATTGCHEAGPEGQPPSFRLFRDPKKSAATLYANFVVLNEVEVNGYKLIDRARPEESLLLRCMLPAKDVKPEQRHPGEATIRPQFQSDKSIGYRRILQWIQSLQHPAEDYGFRLTRFAGTQPAETPEAGEGLEGGDKPAGAGENEP